MGTCAVGRQLTRVPSGRIVDGVTFLHTGLGLLPCDLMPHNVLAKQLSDGLYAVKVADLGSAVEANPSARLPMDKAEIEKTGIRCQTLFYRAPEILFGDAAFGPLPMHRRWAPW